MHGRNSAPSSPDLTMGQRKRRKTASAAHVGHFFHSMRRYVGLTHCDGPLNLSTSPPPTQIVSRSQSSSTTSSSITQKTMLLGSTSPSLSASQAQMYLRAQMSDREYNLSWSACIHSHRSGRTVYFKVASDQLPRGADFSLRQPTVATVQSDIPLISSSAPSTSTQPSATQVQNLTLRNPPILEISCPQNSPPKINNHDQSLAMCHKTTVTSSKTIHTDSYEASLWTHTDTLPKIEVNFYSSYWFLVYRLLATVSNSQSSHILWLNTQQSNFTPIPQSCRNHQRNYNSSSNTTSHQIQTIPY
ncbi:unnamed protein product [Ranitomeya imitator]|uniref:Uncharacterized protein n=1 Tax=Ranitomeya imitator TaxID=111125 RepID=A0ABN9L048_9NEOB|nr:unnamed protein product [Ranitomeya imitator]